MYVFCFLLFIWILNFFVCGLFLLLKVLMNRYATLESASQDGGLGSGETSDVEGDGALRGRRCRWCEDKTRLWRWWSPVLTCHMSSDVPAGADAGERRTGSAAGWTSWRVHANPHEIVPFSVDSSLLLFFSLWNSKKRSSLLLFFLLKEKETSSKWSDLAIRSGRTSTWQSAVNCISARLS